MTNNHDESPAPDLLLTWHRGVVTRADRAGRLGQQGATVWLTGLPSAGKSTVAFALEAALATLGRSAYVLDGDNVRHGLNRNLGFSAADRQENIRRIGEVARLFADAGLIAITSFISPYHRDRDHARELHEADELPFFEVYISTPLAVCEARDPKGLYRLARAGELSGFTGVDDPYEPPRDPELVISTAAISPEASASAILRLLEERGILSPAGASPA